MNRHAPHGIRRRSIVGLVLGLTVVAMLGIAAQQAMAYRTYVHGGIDSCAVCHLDGHTRWKPVNEVCNTCHPTYAVPSASTTCWTCHAPGQDMSGARTDASCTSACHLEDGTTITHVGHADRPATCSTCHPLTASLTDPAGSPHHTRPLPPAPTVAGFLPAAAAVGDAVTVTGTGFTGASAVAFNGASAIVFKVISGTRITAIVPAGASSGPITVATLGGTGTSATSLSVITFVKARVTLRVADTSVALGKIVRLSGALSPVSLAGSSVDIAVKLKSNGSWTTTRTTSASTGPTGAYAWVYRNLRKGSYRVRTTMAETAAHSAAHSQTVAFRVR